MTYFTQFRKNEYVLSDTITKTLTDISQYTEIFSRISDDVSFYTYYNARPDQRLDNISNELYDTPDYYWTIPVLNDSVINTWKSTIRSVPSLNEYLKKKYPGKALIVDSNEDIIGKFTIGEYLRYDNNETYILRDKYPSMNYLRVESAEPPESVVFNETDERRVIGYNSQSVVTVSSVIDWYMAPMRFLDSELNSVPWYVENTTPISIAKNEEELNEAKRELKVIRPEYIKAVVTRFNDEMRLLENG